jgi:hypothetical protein
LRTDSQETWPLRTKPGPVGSFFGNAIEGRNTRRQIDAGARSRPNAPVLAASLDKTIPDEEPARVRRMTGSHSELRDWRFQVPKNRKVFRRIFEPWPEAKAAGRLKSAGRPTPAANYGIIDQGAVLTWSTHRPVSDSAKGKLVTKHRARQSTIKGPACRSMLGDSCASRCVDSRLKNSKSTF